MNTKENFHLVFLAPLFGHIVKIDGESLINNSIDRMKI